MVKMTIGRAKAIAGTLSYPTKLPGTSYALPASKCIIGSKLVSVPGSTCHDCYALKGKYNMVNSVKAMDRRLASLPNPGWVDAMVFLLKQKHSKPEFRIDLGMQALREGRQRWRMNVSGWHRWHDSGDLQGIWHLAKICDVAERTPEIRHWLATREAKMLLDYVGGGGRVPGNLTIRLSSTMVDQGAPTAWPLTSTVHDKGAPIGRGCPAPSQNHECRDCRSCWSREIPNISYRKH